MKINRSNILYIIAILLSSPSVENWEKARNLIEENALNYFRGPGANTSTSSELLRVLLNYAKDCDAEAIDELIDLFIAIACFIPEEWQKDFIWGALVVAKPATHQQMISKLSELIPTTQIEDLIVCKMHTKVGRSRKMFVRVFTLLNTNFDCV